MECSATVGNTVEVSMKLAKPMVQAAKPTSECMIATSSGIWVILTTRAAMMPMVPPTAIAATIQA